MPTKTVLTSRRSAIKAALIGVVGGAVGVRAALAQRVAQSKVAQEKIAQEQVQYQNEPKDGAQCNKCVNWQAPNACTIVAGEIKPTGWCVAYAPKEG